MNMKNQLNLDEINMDSTNTPIFVVGYMHSGTTLMKDIIDGHPSVFSCKGESRFFHSLTMLKRRFPNLNDEITRRQFVTYLAKLANSNYRTVEYDTEKELSSFGLSTQVIDKLIAETAHINDHKAFFKVVFDYFTKSAGKERWLEKTPTHLFHIDKILQSIPNAQFIELVRDPRDVLGSKNSRLKATDKMGSRNEIAEKVKNWRVGYDPIWDSLAWKSAIRSGNETAVKHPSKIMRIRYEDLVNSPEAVSKKVFEFLNLTYTSNLLNVSWHNTADESKWSQNGISSDAIGKWKKRLKPRDIIICQKITNVEMNDLKYSQESMPIVANLTMPIALFKSSLEFFERIYRRYKLGGFQYVRTVIENYLIRFKKIAQPKK